MSSYMKGKIIQIISSIYTFFPANSKVRQIWKFLNECYQTEFVDSYYVMPEPRVKLLLIATHPYSAMLEACVVITALMRRPENNLQLTVSRWKFNIYPNQHLSNKGIKSKTDKFSENCIDWLLERKKESNCSRFFLTALKVFYSLNVFESVNLLATLSLI